MQNTSCFGKPGKLRFAWGRGPVAAVLALAALTAGWAAPAGQPGDPPPKAPDLPYILLANTDKLPRVTVSWPTEDGPAISITGDRPYRSPLDREGMGRNISTYVALGGYRLERGAGNPKGAILRVGLYKIDIGKPFFDDIAHGSSITVTLAGVHMNQPVVPRPKTTVMHLKYTADDLTACGLGGQASSLFCTADPDDTLRGRITPDNGRLGSLDGGPDHGHVTLTTLEDGSVTMTAEIPYALLRHIKDPWLRSVPGTFLEPTHFHLEFEVLPTAVAAALDAPPPAEPPPLR